MDEKSPQLKRRGRPPKSEKTRRDGNLTFRVRSGIREKLQAQADARGMSISEEIERRLVFSFDIATSPCNEFIIRAIAESIKVTEMVSGRSWGSNPVAAEMCFNAVKSAASVMLASHDYSNKNDELQRIAVDAGRFIGINAAKNFAFVPIDELEAASSEGIMNFYREVVGLDGENGRLYEAMYGSNIAGLSNVARFLDASKQTVGEKSSNLDEPPAPPPAPAPAPRRKARATA